MFLEDGYQRRDGGLWVPKDGGLRLGVPGIPGQNSAAWPMAPRLTYISGGNDNTNTATYTFTAQSLGVLSAGRRIVVAAGVVGPSFAARLITGITVAGVATSLIAQSQATASATNIAIGQVIDAANTSGDIVVTTNAATVGCGIAVYSLTGPASVYDNDGSITAANGGAVAATLDVLFGYPYLVAAMGGSSTTTTWSFSGATLDAIQKPNTNTPISFAHANGAASALNYAETATPSANLQQRSIVGVSWR